MDAVFSRRSIRSYTEEPVTSEQMEQILKAAMAAPSANNQQPWHFVVITDRKILKTIAFTHPHAKMAENAAAAIVVCGDPTGTKSPGYWVQDCSAAVENMLIEITAMGLGAVWCGVYPREDRVKELRQITKVPEPFIPFALVPLGHPPEVREPVSRFDVKRIHHEQWGNA